MRSLIYEYKDALSLRDEIGPCPNIEVEMEMTDKESILYKTISCWRRRQSHSR